MRIREAQPDDAPAVAELLAQLGYPNEPAEVAERLATWRATDHARVLVADEGGAAIGVASVCAYPQLARPGRRARLASLAVDAGHRRRGVGASLVRAAEQLAREWGCDEMEITARRTRPEAPAFYPALGYEDRSPRQARFMRPLSPAGGASPPPPRAARR
jgi:GNAT superfamily N-acetyltransferase